MNYFEQELQKLAAVCDGLSNPVFVGRTCYGDLGGDNRAKLQFVTVGHADHYTALKATILNRIDGEVDTLLLRFGDIWGNKRVNNPNFRDGVIPYIWTYKDEIEWYVYQPTGADFKQLGKAVGTYLEVFTDRSALRQKEQAQESVVKKLRENKQTPAAPKDKTSRGKSGPEL